MRAYLLPSPHLNPSRIRTHTHTHTHTHTYIHTHTYTHTLQYIEVDIDVSANNVASYVTAMVRGATKSLTIDMGECGGGYDVCGCACGCGCECECPDSVL